ncbi:MAG: DUF721 domain-containing protein [Boseongicola sp.]|nr:DUF721 domain-containing protein [Boseongicola sp.]
MKDFRRKRGFERASSLVAGRVRTASETRGFAVSRLLTHWDDIVGSDLCGLAKPIDIKYGKSFGATLTLLVKGAEAPMVEMQKETIRERVNACYGYAAIQTVRLTQTAPRGFAEGQEPFEGPSKSSVVSPEAREKAAQTVEIVSDTSLREALERLGANVISQSKQK